MITFLAVLQYAFGVKMLRKWIGIGLYFLIGAVAADLVGDPKAGQAKSGVCTACHNADGNATVPAWPKIAGQPVRYLIEQLKEYRKGDKGARFNPVMFGIVQSLTDQDIADLAAFFSSQKSTPGTAEQGSVALGQRIYRGGNSKTGVPACEACHSPTGLGNSPAGFPPLSGQHPDYIIDQLKAFRSGVRSNDPNEIMRDISKRMSDEEIEAVGNYVSGLH